VPAGPGSVVSEAGCARIRWGVISQQVPTSEAIDRNVLWNRLPAVRAGRFTSQVRVVSRGRQRFCGGHGAKQKTSKINRSGIYFT